MSAYCQMYVASALKTSIGTQFIHTQMAGIGAKVRAFLGRQTYNYYASSARYYQDHGQGYVYLPAELHAMLQY